VSTRGRRATARRRRPWATDLRAATSGRRDTSDQRSGPGRCWATRPRPPVAGNPMTRGRRPQVNGPGPASDQRSPTGYGSIPALVGQFPFFVNFFFSLLPSTFCASGQLLLVGSSTCPSCPNFSLKLQTPITFDP
jgi:hypothetical protein